MASITSLAGNAAKYADSKRSLSEEDTLSNTSTWTSLLEEEPLDLLVIGAGPHALSLVTRIIDDEPDLMTEAERSYIMQRGTRARSRAQVRNHLKKRFDSNNCEKRQNVPRTGSSDSIHNSTLVIDSHGRWMAQWEADFEAFGIEYLRSHEHLHPDPFDFQALSVWAEMQKRSSELKEMKCVDREECRRAGYYGPFVTPSSKLFLDFCKDLVARYALADIVRKGTVQEVRILEEPHSDGEFRDQNSDSLSVSSSDVQSIEEASPKKPLLEVVLSDGRRFLARRVVCAMGPGPAFQGMRAILPSWADELEDALSEDGLHERELGADFEPGTQVQPSAAPKVDPARRLQHSSSLNTWLLKTEATSVLWDRRVLIVGGGQTSAHLAHVALSRGASTVTLCSRKRISRKPYDVDVAFVGSRRPVFLQQFWQLEDFKSRKQFNATLRCGGSMSSEVYAELTARIGDRLDVAEENEVVQAHWRPAEEEVEVRFDDGRVACFDFVWLATGGNFDMELVPVFASLQSQRPIPSVDGLPRLQPDLSWAADVPVHVLGAFSQLQLGADALNLAGARSGGVVVARALLGEGLGAAERTGSGFGRTNSEPGKAGTNKEKKLDWEQPCRRSTKNKCHRDCCE